MSDIGNFTRIAELQPLTTLKYGELSQEATKYLESYQMFIKTRYLIPPGSSLEQLTRTLLNRLGRKLSYFIPPQGRS